MVQVETEGVDVMWERRVDIFVTLIIVLVVGFVGVATNYAQRLARLEQRLSHQVIRFEEDREQMARRVKELETSVYTVIGVERTCNRLFELIQAEVPAEDGEVQYQRLKFAGDLGRLPPGYKHPCDFPPSYKGLVRLPYGDYFIEPGATAGKAWVTVYRFP